MIKVMISLHRIDAKGIIKVADFGLSEDVYTSNYYCQGKEKETKLPIRWMAVESIVDGIYSEKSDVVRHINYKNVANACMFNIRT